MCNHFELCALRAWQTHWNGSRRLPLRWPLVRRIRWRISWLLNMSSVYTNNKQEQLLHAQDGFWLCFALCRAGRVAKWLLLIPTLIRSQSQKARWPKTEFLVRSTGTTKKATLWRSSQRNQYIKLRHVLPNLRFWSLSTSQNHTTNTIISLSMPIICSVATTTIRKNDTEENESIHWSNSIRQQW